nr:nuclear body protein SP140-like [Peromyscus maniculatus bairdii]
MFKHFHENKVEIASAITKPFPFLMSLQDRGFISEQKFQTRPQKKCKTLDAAGKVVYDILSDLQKKFSLPLLQVIFSTTHLKAYPDLKETMRSFLDGLQMILMGTLYLEIINAKSEAESLLSEGHGGVGGDIVFIASGSYRQRLQLVLPGT